MEKLLPFTAKQQRKIKDTYTALDSQEGGIIPADCNIIIDDVGITPKDKQALDELTNRRLIFIDPTQLMPQAIQSIDSSLQDGSVIVVPREGGKKITDRYPREIPAIEILITRDPANTYEGRVINPSDSQELLDKLSTLQPEQLAVADDVIVSGATAKFLREFTETNLGTTYLWSITTWLMAFPRKVSAPSGVEGYSKSTTSLLYAGESGRTPVNTLWDMLYNPKKKDLVVPAYAQKFSSDPVALQQLIDSLANKYRGQL